MKTALVMIVLKHSCIKVAVGAAVAAVAGVAAPVARVAAPPRSGRPSSVAGGSDSTSARAGGSNPHCATPPGTRMEVIMMEVNICIHLVVYITKFNYNSI